MIHLDDDDDELTLTHIQLSFGDQAFNSNHSCSGPCHAERGEAALVSKNQSGSSFHPFYMSVFPSAKLAFTKHQHGGKLFHMDHRPQAQGLTWTYMDKNESLQKFSAC